MLIDMTRWRTCKVADRSFAHLQRYGKHIFFNEQEALNAVIGHDWEPLEDRWNYSTNPFHSRQQSLAGALPAIIHFAGRTKPWKLPDLGEVQDLFFQQLDKTAWRGTRPRRTVKNRVLSRYIKSPLRHLTYPLENWYLRLSHRMEI
jgi:lipopolysaccharide biosynthesis glycosyltransferase